MKSINRKILEQVIEASAEPVVVLRVDRPDWPVVLVNGAFDAISGGESRQKPFADVVEHLVGRELALEISEAVRSRQESNFPAELGGREYLLALQPLPLPNEATARYYAVYWRGGAKAGTGSEIHHALLKAKRRIRDLSRDDPVTGLLNGMAFREILEHDWAVALREESSLAIVAFTIDEFESYTEVFGRHAADTCLRRVGRAVRRCLRRASDVVARVDGAQFVVLSHSSDEKGVREFAARISTSVRELGLHHPRSSVARFVTVTYQVAYVDGAADRGTADAFLDELLGGTAN